MIRLHHLRRSRSTRIIWLLEELGLPYDLVSYDRMPNIFAPPELRAVHPLGKAPVIEDGDLKIAESSAIIEYLVATHGDWRLAPARSGPRWAEWIEWLHYAEGSAMTPILITMVGARTGTTEAMDQYLARGVKRTLDHLTDTIERTGHLMREGFTAADIQMFYVLEGAKMAGLLRDRDTLRDYLDRIEQRPAFRRAIEVGGPVPLHD